MSRIKAVLLVTTLVLCAREAMPGDSELALRGSVSVKGMLPLRLDFSPNGERLALSGMTGQASTNAAMTSLNLTNVQRAIALVDVGNPKAVRQLVKGGGADIFPDPIAISWDGRRVMTTVESTIQVWDADSGRAGSRWGREVATIAFSLDRTVALTRTRGGSYEAFDLGDGHVLTLTESKKEAGTLLPVDARYLYLLLIKDARPMLRNLVNGEETAVGEAGVEYATDQAAATRDAKRIALAEKAGGLVVWDLAEARSAARLERSGALGNLSFSNSGLLAFSADGKVSVWDPVSGALRSADPQFFMGVGQVAFSPDSRMLAVTAQMVGAAVKLYDVPAAAAR